MRAGITELVRCTISARPNGSISRQRFLPRYIQALRRDLAPHGGRAYMLQADSAGRDHAQHDVGAPFSELAVRIYEAAPRRP
jgi:hypothetical protein